MADRPSRPFPWIALVAVAALVPVACDGDDDDADVTSAPVADDADGGAETTAATPGDTDDGDTDDGDAQDVGVTIVGVAEGFEPPTISVAAGTEVVWTNVDVLVHTTTADDGTWDSGNLGMNETFSFVASEPGTYPYFCSIHPSMVGELVVE
ncbi:cupredoxin domain-containing protein [Marivita sp.]|uniref:cupredoxin domain-containing protein n=1 Tax=Marivita sp. TaxID=2003365 RepID=UPI0025BC6120|nr:cupredoxin domain-containing protein [Marivita sp.]